MQKSGETVDHADGPLDVYVNAARFSVGVYDFMLELGTTEPTTDPAKPAGTTQLVRVRMSPQHAAILARAFAEAVDTYERQVGKISIPAAIIRQMGMEP